MTLHTNFQKICTQDRHGFYEEIRLESGKYHYFLFDSPHKAWKTFESLNSCKQFIQEELNQPFIQFESLSTYLKFIWTAHLDHACLWIEGKKVPTYTEEISQEAIILIDTGKDWITLRQDIDLSFFWEPQLDPHYKTLGEKIVTIQDAIRKIDDMPIYIFNSKMEATLFFENTYPKPKLIKIVEENKFS